MFNCRRQWYCFNVVNAQFEQSFEVLVGKEEGIAAINDRKLPEITKLDLSSVDNDEGDQAEIIERADEVKINALKKTVSVI